jgi:RHS repeat-associated protein
MQYDALHRLIRLTDPEGYATIWNYDEAVPSWVTDRHESGVKIVSPSGRARYLQFDFLGRVSNVVEPAADGSGSISQSSSRTVLSYDLNGNLESISDAGARQLRRRIRYDSLGRPVRVFLPECGGGIVEGGFGRQVLWSFAMAYDERSNLVFRKDSRGAIVRYDYGGDPVDRLQHIRYDRSEVTDTSSEVLGCGDVHYFYQPDGDIRRVNEEYVDGIGNQTFTYDSFNGLISTTVQMAGAPPFTIDYPHDSVGRSTGTIYPVLYGDSAARPTLDLQYQIGGISRLTLDGQQIVDHLAFWPSGALKSMQLGLDDPEGVTETYDWDVTASELKGQQLFRGREPLMNVSYDYYPPTLGTSQSMVRQVKTATDHLQGSGNRTYTYDALGRLRTATGGDLWTQSYTYDSFGNRTEVSATGIFAPGQPATTDGEAHLTYDEDTNRLSLIDDSPDSGRFDAAGNLVEAIDSSGQGWKYEYDTAGRLARVRDMPRDTSSADTIYRITEYVYGACNRRRATMRRLAQGDPMPNRIQFVIAGLQNWWWRLRHRRGAANPRLPNNTIESVKYYAWNGDHVIAEYDDNPEPDQGSGPSWSLIRLYMGSRLLATRRRLGDGTVRTEYDHPGLTGTRFVTSAVGDYEHESLPFGSATLKEGGAPPFTSFERDEQNGLDYAVNRYYSSQLGRFLQPDPLGIAGLDPFDPQSFNLYTYCQNDPIDRIDPLGLVDEEVCQETNGQLCGPVVVVVGHLEPESWRMDVGGGPSLGFGPGKGGGGGGSSGPSAAALLSLRQLKQLARLLLQLWKGEPDPEIFTPEAVRKPPAIMGGRPPPAPPPTILDILPLFFVITPEMERLLTPADTSGLNDSRNWT